MDGSHGFESIESDRAACLVGANLFGQSDCDPACIAAAVRVYEHHRLLGDPTRGHSPTVPARRGATCASGLADGDRKKPTDGRRSAPPTSSEALHRSSVPYIMLTVGRCSQRGTL